MVFDLEIQSPNGDPCFEQTVRLKERSRGTTCLNGGEAVNIILVAGISFTSTTQVHVVRAVDAVALVCGHKLSMLRARSRAKILVPSCKVPCASVITL